MEIRSASKYSIANPFLTVKFFLLILSLWGITTTAQAQPDYAPAAWIPAACTKYYNNGNGHKFVVIHDMEGYYASTISYLNRCDENANGDYNVATSVHYAVNGLNDGSGDSAAGAITQMVRESKYAWHARCWNTWSFGTEHEGFVSNPAWYTKAMYIASSGLQRHLCDAYGIAKDRNHIVGHGEKSNAAWVAWMAINMPSVDTSCNDHTDPGVYWNWNYFMDLITKTNVTTGRYWDLNGTTAGAGSTPNGTWDNTSTNWSDSANGTVVTGIWPLTDDAVFAAGTDATNNYTVTVSGTQSVYSLRVLNANVTFTGGKLIFTGIGSYYSNYVAAGFTTTFNTPITGPGAPDKWGPGTVIYNGTSNPSGYFSLNEGTLALGNNSALGTNRFVIGDPSGANVVTIKAASVTARTLANRLVFNANNFTFAAGGDLTFTGGIDLTSSGSSTITVNNNTTFSGILSNNAGLTKTGTGTLTFAGSDTNANVYGSLTTVSGGILKLQKEAGLIAIPATGLKINAAGTVQLATDNQINNSAPLTLSGGLFNTGGLDEQLGTLAMTANSRIDLGAGNSVLKFATSSGVAWTAATTLTVSNWSGSINGAGTDQLFFGANSSGLTATQVNQIKFVNPLGFAAGIYSAKILATGEVVPVAVPPSIAPQPQNVIAIVGSNATFNVTASGTSTLIYQWTHAGTNFPATTSSSMTMNNVTLAQAGDYFVTVTNIAGSISSSNAVLSVYATAAATFTSFGATGDGEFTLNISGVPGYNYIIQDSTNLLDWKSILTNVSPFSFTKTNATDYPSQFYRAVYAP